MKIDEAGLAFLTQEEGLRLKPYLDTKGIPTIGIGATVYEDGTRVTMNDPALTKERALLLFRNLLTKYEEAVAGACPVELTQNQFNALCSLCYNIGTSAFRKSTIARRVTANASDPTIEAAFEMWSKPPELLPRRKREAKLYFT